jgi:hypothetical protein
MSNQEESQIIQLQSALAATEAEVAQLTRALRESHARILEMVDGPKDAMRVDRSKDSPGGVDKHLALPVFDSLERARRNANLGLPVPAKTRFSRAKRLLARAMWLTNRQQVVYNQSVIHALQGSMEYLSSLIDTKTAAMQASVQVEIDQNTSAALRSDASLEASLRSELAASLLDNARRDREIGQLRAEMAAINASTLSRPDTAVTASKPDLR